MSIFVIFIIAVSLSMDAFSLSLAYGTLNLNKKQIVKLSFIVGIYHFVMPLLGLIVGTGLFNIIPIKPNFIIFVILTFIGIQMIIETFKDDRKIEFKNVLQLLIFGLAVSIDSFSVGVGLKAINSDYLLCSVVFSITSFIFTYFGLVLGNKISQLVGRISTIIGGLVLILIGIISLF